MAGGAVELFGHESHVAEMVRRLKVLAVPAVGELNGGVDHAAPTIGDVVGEVVGGPTTAAGPVQPLTGGSERQRCRQSSGGLGASV